MEETVPHEEELRYLHAVEQRIYERAYPRRLQVALLGTSGEEVHYQGYKRIFITADAGLKIEGTITFPKVLDGAVAVSGMAFLDEDGRFLFTNALCPTSAKDFRMGAAGAAGHVQLELGGYIELNNVQIRVESLPAL